MDMRGDIIIVHYIIITSTWVLPSYGQSQSSVDDLISDSHSFLKGFPLFTQKARSLFDTNPTTKDERKIDEDKGQVRQSIRRQVRK